MKSWTHLHLRTYFLKIRVRIEIPIKFATVEHPYDLKGEMGLKWYNLAIYAYANGQDSRLFMKAVAKTIPKTDGKLEQASKGYEVITIGGFIWNSWWSRYWAENRCLGCGWHYLTFELTAIKRFCQFQKEWQLSEGAGESILSSTVV